MKNKTSTIIHVLSRLYWKYVGSSSHMYVAKMAAVGDKFFDRPLRSFQVANFVHCMSLALHVILNGFRLLKYRVRVEVGQDWDSLPERKRQNDAEGPWLISQIQVLLISVSIEAVVDSWTDCTAGKGKPDQFTVFRAASFIASNIKQHCVNTFRKKQCSPVVMIIALHIGLNQHYARSGTHLNFNLTSTGP